MILPTGPVVVCVFGLLLLLAYAARKVMGVESKRAVPA